MRQARRQRCALEPAHQFFEHEHRTGDWCVEGGGETRARAGGEQDASVVAAATPQLAQPMSDRGAHLDARAFTAECEAGADRQQAAKKLDRDQGRWRWPHFAGQRGLDMRDAAAGGVRGEPSDQPGGQGHPTAQTATTRKKPATFH